MFLDNCLVENYVEIGIVYMKAVLEHFITWKEMGGKCFVRVSMHSAPSFPFLSFLFFSFLGVVVMED